MTWTKLSDDFSDDCWRLSSDAFRLHTEALVWSNRKLLDCRIPKADLRRFAKSPDAVEELLHLDYWLDDGDAYLIVHHARYQRTAEQVLNQQKANRENRAKRPRGKGTGAPREVVNESSNDSLNDSHDERDGTGLVGNPNYISNYKRDSKNDQLIDQTTGEVLTGDDPWRLCHVCQKTIVEALWLEGSRTHPACDLEAAA